MRVEGINIEEKLPISIILLKPADGFTHSLGAEIIFFVFSMMDIAEILGYCPRRIPEFFRGAGEFDLFWGSAISIVLLPSNPEPGGETSCVVIAFVHKMGSIGDEHSRVAGRGKELGEDDFVLGKGSPIGVGEGESTREEVSPIGDGGEGGGVVIHKDDGFLSEFIKVRRLRFKGLIAIEGEVISSKCVGNNDYEIQIRHRKSLLFPKFYILISYSCNLFERGMGFTQLKNFKKILESLDKDKSKGSFGVAKSIVDYWKKK